MPADIFRWYLGPCLHAADLQNQPGKLRRRKIMPESPRGNKVVCIHSYLFLTPYHELARTANPRVLLPSCSFLGAIFTVALGRAALLPWHQPAQLLGEKEMRGRPKQGARDGFSTRADLSGRLSPCASSKERLAPHHPHPQHVVLTSQAHQL